MMIDVFKVGGHEIADDGFLTELAATVAAHPRPVILVHGGGKEISDLQRALGIEPHYIDGVRVTDAASLKVVQMVLAGLVNKRLVSYLIDAGVNAIGLTGVDRGLIQARQMSHPTQDMGYTGEIVSVQADILYDCIAQGITPVIAPLCIGAHHTIFNVNADHVAGAVGAAIHAEQTVFITNVEGVLQNGGRVPTLTAQQAHTLITDGVINGGMIPKVKTALNALSGVNQTVITNLHGLKTHGGTVFGA